MTLINGRKDRVPVDVDRPDREAPRISSSCRRRTRVELLSSVAVALDKRLL